MTGAARKALAAAGVAALLLGLPALWKWTPLSDWASVDNAVALFSALRASEYVAVWVVALYALGAVLFLPINLFIFVTALFFDNLWAYVYVALGVAANAATGYLIGRLGGSIVIRRIDSQRIERLSRRFANAEFTDLFLFRLIPVTPFSTLNVVCGMLELPPLKFFAATFASIAPGATLIILFETALMAFAQNMTWLTGTLLTLALGVIVGAAFLVRHASAARRQDAG